MKLLIIAAAVLLHCSKADDLSITKASNRFAAELYREVAKEPGNVLVCPMSVHIALALIHQGANGYTARELERVLHLQGSKNQIKNQYKDILSGLETDVLKIATKLFPAITFKPNDNFANASIEYFLSGVQAVDYSKAEEAANIINTFVQEKTNNKIHDIIKSDALSELTRLIIVNAVYFKANWAKTFPPARIDTFKMSPTESVKTEFMGQTDYYAYKDDGDLQAKVLKMDYEKGAYSMVFVLPNKEFGLEEVENKLATKSMDEILSGMKEARVDVTIPKFKIEQEHQLKEVLSKMGIMGIFDSRADLRGVADAENLAVDSVIQKTFIDVNEKGTEASAATGVVTPLSGGSEENMFIAKRPFHFYLIHTQTPLVILFSGRFVKAEEKISPNKEEGNFNTSNEEESLEKIGNEQVSAGQNHKTDSNTLITNGGHKRPTTQTRPTSPQIRPQTRPETKPETVVVNGWPSPPSTTFRPAPYEQNLPPTHVYSNQNKLVYGYWRDGIFYEVQAPRNPVGYPQTQPGVQPSQGRLPAPQTQIPPRYSVPSNVYDEY